MRRDLDLIRLLLLQIEGEDKPDLSDYSDEQIKYHKMLLIEAGLADGKYSEHFDYSGPIILAVSIQRLTWEGHEFLEAVRDDELWQQVKTTVKGIKGFTFEIVKAIAINFLTGQLS